MVPLVGVLYVLALVSFSIAGYYGFRLTTMARKMKIMVMITQDGPQSIVGGIVLLASSQVVNILNVIMQTTVDDYFAVASVVLLVGSAIMFAFGFQKMFSVYLNEKTRMNVASVLGGLFEKDSEEHVKWQGELR
ncbi:MAG: hypothetical protein ACYC7D_05710 [Nitrososphaerales archaeon]